MPYEPDPRLVLETRNQEWPRWSKVKLEVATTYNETIGDDPPTAYSGGGVVTLDRWPAGPGPEDPTDPDFDDWGMAWSRGRGDGGQMTHSFRVVGVAGDVSMEIIGGIYPELVPADRLRGRPDGMTMRVAAGVSDANHVQIALYGPSGPTVSEPSPGTVITHTTEGNTTEDVDLTDFTAGPLSFSGTYNYTYTSDVADAVTITATCTLVVTFIE